ncbi:hypothetical protein [Tenacibaculum maritimum]|uniref:hypothetical protein n=1 Tax=Tenacibaculum maritimum TaxID=107401 RepID=UPI003877846E
MKNLIVRPSNSLDIKVQTVKTAYFAKKEIVSTEKTTEAISYTFKGNNNTGTKKRKCKIAKIIYKNLQGKLINKQQTSLEQVVAALSKSNYTKGDCIDIALVKERIKFTKRTSAQLGEEVYIIIQTQYMPDREITLNLKQGGDTDALTTTKEPIYVTQNNKKVFAFKAVVGEFSQKSNALNAADFKDHAIAKITLQSTNKQENKQYKDALNKAEGKTSPFYIAMDAEPANQNWFEVKYEEVFDNRPNLWYYGEGNWFELKTLENANIYEVHLDRSSYKKIKTVSNNKDFIYKIYDSQKLVKTYQLTANSYNLLDFPKKGDNWDRYGSRDKGGDNWIDEAAAAGFFGFLHTLKKNGINEKVYYNDISANDKRNIGHKTHKTGHDIDIRYPGADNSVGQKLWSISKDYYKTEEKFVKVLEDILSISIDWGFMKKYNYAYKKDIKHTSGKAISVHQDHYHIGFKR